jgi:hypothetical protein
MLPAALALLKQEWPTAKTFTAVATYWPQVVETVRRQQEAARRRKDDLQRDRELVRRFDRQAQERQRFVDHWRPRWDDLPQGERSAIRGTVLAGKEWLQAMPDKLLHECLLVLSRRADGNERDASDAQASAETKK